MKKIIISIEYDEKKFVDGEEEIRFINILQHDVDSVCLEFIEEAPSNVIISALTV